MHLWNKFTSKGFSILWPYSGLENEWMDLPLHLQKHYSQLWFFSLAETIQSLCVHVDSTNILHYANIMLYQDSNRKYFLPVQLDYTGQTQ